MSNLKRERFVHPDFDDEILVTYRPGTWEGTAVKGSVSYQVNLRGLLEAGWVSKKPNRYVLSRNLKKTFVPV